MNNRETKTVSISGAVIRFRNFSGEEQKFNPAGRRNFCVLLSQQMADEMSSDGWNIKELHPKNEEDEPQPYLQVSVSYTNVPPKIVLISGNNKTLLDEETVGQLDYVEMENVDLIINPYHWEVNGKSGVKAYVKTMYVVMMVDEFEAKYSKVPAFDENGELVE